MLGLERDAATWVKVNAQVQGEGSPEGRHLFRGGSSLGKAKRMGHWHMSQQYVVGSYQHASEFGRAGS